LCEICRDDDIKISNKESLNREFNFASKTILVSAGAAALAARQPGRWPSVACSTGEILQPRQNLLNSLKPDTPLKTQQSQLPDRSEDERRLENDFPGHRHQTITLCHRIVTLTAFDPKKCGGSIGTI